MDYQKAMLADLMSQYVEVDNKDFWDDSVCKNYLVAFCPHLLFTNTKSDLGACTKIHNDRLRDKYQQSDKSKYPYEDDFYTFLQQLINDVSRKIRNGRERVNLQDEKKKESKEMVNEERHEKIVLLEVKIKEYLQKIEEAGEEGRVQEASDLTNQVERLQAELKLLKEMEEMASKSDKRMEVCEVCGALLVTHDSTEKPTAHYDGKQHIGYMKIREALEKRNQQSRHSSHDRDYSRARYDYRRDNNGSRDYRQRHHDRSRRDNYQHDRRRHRDRQDDDWNREMERYDRGRRQREYSSRRSRSRSPRRW
ncbi:uncharacterized protein BX664DRAFT_344454 [Halteromyces radiatus]|uniref:uncharacterized protein n=1 Tax=Halteromyces radiatus TaxID=101107 RepID=UPI00221F0D6A|nr:uncharacterized protein BX664DRAFT_344454 [Halteromyces radiatus]KAI8076352.1 hypothetical protein BX664DRAFT_344454 [Halteromyces radiatus]